MADKGSEEKVRVYCDPCIFIALFKKEVGRFEICRRIVEDSKSGKIELITSYATLIECGRTPHNAAAEKGSWDTTADFFDSEFIKTVNVDFCVANYARRIQQEHSVTPYDALHLGTAQMENAHYFFTFYSDLIRLNGMTGTLSGLIISEPEHPWDQQLDLDGMANKSNPT